jgi:hypothetical protein
MELILKFSSKQKPVKITALTRKLNTLRNAGKKGLSRNDLRERILNFKAVVSSAFGDAAEWEKAQRLDRELLF